MASFKGIVSVVGAFYVQLKHFLTNSNGILKDQNVMLFQLAKKQMQGDVSDDFILQWLQEEKNLNN